MSNETKITNPLNVDSILLKASQEILAKQDGFCFSVDNQQITDDETANNTFYTPHDSSVMAEFVNFDMLEEGGENPFDHLTSDKQYEDITKDGGVLKLLLDPGVGHVVPEDSIVLLHYIGYVSNIPEPFDVTYLQGKRPKSFRLGVGDLLLGLEVAILTMRYGENARIILSPKYAYREMGCPPRIPPNATVLFDVHLVSYFPSSESLYFSEDEKNDPYRFQTNLKVVKKLHYEGNEFFKMKRIEKAVTKYEKAKELLHLTGCSNSQEEIEMFKHLNKLYSNLSICYLKLSAFNKVCRMGSEGMRYSERFSRNNVKLWFNWGKALRLLKDFTEGKKKLQRALKLEPENESIHYEIQRLETDRAFHYRIKSLSTLKNEAVDDNKRFPSEFWQVFDTMINAFVDSTDEILTVTLNNNTKDIELAKHKVNVLDLQFQQNENVNSHCFTIKKKL